MNDVWYETMINEEKIIEKRKEIEDYQRILLNYRGRWWDMGKRHLDQLKVELDELEKGPSDGPFS